MPQESRPWLLSKSAALLLGALSWTTIVTLVLGVSFALVLRSGDIDLGNSRRVAMAAWLLFGLIAVIVVGEWILWICMLWFCMRYYRGGPGKRLLWIIVQLLGLSVASAFLYFCIYSPQRAKRTINTGLIG